MPNNYVVIGKIMLNDTCLFEIDIYVFIWKTNFSHLESCGPEPFFVKLYLYWPKIAFLNIYEKSTKVSVINYVQKEAYKGMPCNP